MNAFKPGDAVRVAHTCPRCRDLTYVGLIFTVSHLLPDPPGLITYDCTKCGAPEPRRSHYRVVSQERGANGKLYAFLPWQLEKLPPLDEPVTSEEETVA